MLLRCESLKPPLSQLAQTRPLPRRPLHDRSSPENGSPIAILQCRIRAKRRHNAVQQNSTDLRSYFASCLASALLGRRSVNTEPLPGSLVTVTPPPIMRASLRARSAKTLLPKPPSANPAHRPSRRGRQRSSRRCAMTCRSCTLRMLGRRPAADSSGHGYRSSSPPSRARR
jgi:hypothetical protein